MMKKALQFQVKPLANNPVITWACIALQAWFFYNCEDKFLTFI